jgi:hydroxymethylglutaryl-CoA lyase
LPDPVKIVECPRDAWQALPRQIPAQQKADYLRSLIATGFTHIDAASFVSPKAVPQMADSEEVLQLLDPPRDLDLIGIVVNEKGAERAIATGHIRTLGFPYSISPTFLHRNQNQTPEQSLDVLRTIMSMAGSANMNVVAYVSMAFGNPYGDEWSVENLTAACNLLIDAGLKEISLADTVGLATPKQIGETFTAVRNHQASVEIGVHLHARPQDAAAKIRAAFEAGCLRFDGAIGGLGGCPFAQDSLVGNLATETLITELKNLGAQLPVLQPLDGLISASHEIAVEFDGATK